MLKVHGKINHKHRKEKSNWGKTFYNIWQSKTNIPTIDLTSKCRHANIINLVWSGLKT